MSRFVVVEILDVFERVETVQFPKDILNVGRRRDTLEMSVTQLCNMADEESYIDEMMARGKPLSIGLLPASFLYGTRGDSRD